MCGIMGYYSFGNIMPDKQKITDMFSLLETRGRDASGFAFIKDENLIVKKDAIRSSEFVNTNDWKELELPSSLILHTRMKTQGSEKNNANNHPLFSKNGVAIVHNGIIYNDKEIFGKKQRDAEVDSESILHLLSMKVKEEVLFPTNDEASPFGLYDIPGNVREYIWDARNEPTSIGYCYKDFVKYYSNPYAALISARNISSDRLYDANGFRIVKPILGN